ncbi:hypothetical protein [Castellaniella sp.]|uniref:hypothetical protein n=1 Tax=Castellaniella sp. TaxID=1955812 RepID=UPI002AFF6FD0|nr:hypothetical protein [Castellaniella sp.]
MKKFLCTMSDRSVKPHCRWAVITDDGYVDPTDDDCGTPIEDFVMYFCSDIEVSRDQAFEIFMRLIEASEDGERANLRDVIDAVVAST